MRHYVTYHMLRKHWWLKRLKILRRASSFGEKSSRASACSETEFCTSELFVSACNSSSTSIHVPVLITRLGKMRKTKIQPCVTTSLHLHSNVRVTARGKRSLFGHLGRPVRRLARAKPRKPRSPESNHITPIKEQTRTPGGRDEQESDVSDLRLY